MGGGQLQGAACALQSAMEYATLGCFRKINDLWLILWECFARRSTVRVSKSMEKTV